jgi:RecB family exonuclease
VITPRQTRLVRVPDLQAFRAAIATLAAETRRGPAASRAVIVPTRGAASQLQATIRQLMPAVPLPLLLTRDELYDTLHARLVEPPRRLTLFERDGLAQAAAYHAAQGAPDLPFKVRPGLVAEILRFYDQLRRQAQQVKRFEELIVEALGGTQGDRGADRLLLQTQFIAGTFREYERRAAATGACDEHTLRERLLGQPVGQPVGQPGAPPLTHVIVTLPDWIADPAGLFVADFNLLARLPHLAALDIVCTESVLASGFHERLHNWWPGLDEIDAVDLLGVRPRIRPTAIVPEDADDDLWFTHRDREEELIACARRLSTPVTDGAALERTAIVFKQPLPYLYLAPDVFGDAGLPYQISDALPLAAEPVVAAVDLVLEAVETRFARTSLIALLRSPHFRIEPPIPAAGISSLDRALSDQRYLGDLERLEQVAVTLAGKAGPLGEAPTEATAIDAALALARELSVLLEPAPASTLLTALLGLLQARFAPLDADDPLLERERSGRTRVIEILSALADAHARHYDPIWSLDQLAAAVRRSFGDETFVTQTGEAGLHLIDDQAARYGDFDDLTIVGLIENEWPERPRRNIFYPPTLLKALGWPSEKDRRAAADARFIDLIASSHHRVELSTFTLEDEALVTRSLQLDEVPRAGLSTMTRSDAGQDAGEFTGDWADLRSGRSAASASEFHGVVGPRPPRPWSVSALETYLGCPFKFYAQHVLRLAEEPDDEEVMDPRRQGQFVHEVFEKFFAAWGAAGHRGITAANLDTARAMFVEVVDRALERLSEGEAGLERTRLLGSSAAAGLGDAVFRMEAERPVAVVERLLEHKFEGPFTIETEAGPRVVQLRGKADRVDLLADGTFRLIDYKLGWPPDKSRALQLPIYALLAEQRLSRHRGRAWVLGEAMYLAFKGPKRVVPLFSSTANRDEMVARAQQRVADTIDAIGQGLFPPSPDDVYRCESCSFTAVCRKDYVGDV